MNNTDDNIVVLIEDTTLKLQKLLSTMVNDRIKRDIIGTEAKRIINECVKKLQQANCDKAFIEKQRQAFMLTFTNWYNRITLDLAKLAQKTKNPTFYQSYKEITGIEPKISGKAIIINTGVKNNYETGGVNNIRDYFTTGETGYSQMFIDDYQKRVNREIMRIASMNVVLVDRKGRTMSARNLAEMQVRYEEQVKDFEKLDEKGVKFVVATSHANASERCQPWQGKIFELDAKVGDVKIGKEIQHGEPIPKGKMPDGKNYYSLKEAMEKGFLGYNCRHRIIEYKSGMIMPKQYTENQINKERNIEQTARSLERQIRNAKKKSMLANNTLDRKKYQEQSKMLQDTYWDYCKDHDYQVAEWRTRVAINEREGIKSGGISSEINNNNKGNEYESLEVSKSYRNETRNIVLENKIESLVGVSNKVPKLMQEKLGLDKGAIIIFRRASQFRQGSVEHIIKSHTSEINDEYIQHIRMALESPKSVNYLFKAKNNQDRYEMIIETDKYSKKDGLLLFKVYVDKVDDNTFEIVSAHYKSNKKRK